LLNRYKEIFYGLLLGFGACGIDVVMHSRMEGRSLWDEAFRFDAMPFVYRLLFIVFGLALGWSLWTRSTREREFRRLAEIYERFHREVADPAFLIHAKCEELLWLDDTQLPAKARDLVRFVYDKTRSIESLAKERLSIATKTP
jgi:hypothetical protein